MAIVMMLATLKSMTMTMETAKGYKLVRTGGQETATVTMLATTSTIISMTEIATFMAVTIVTENGLETVDAIPFAMLIHLISTAETAMMKILNAPLST